MRPATSPISKPVAAPPAPTSSATQSEPPAGPLGSHRRLPIAAARHAHELRLRTPELHRFRRAAAPGGGIAEKLPDAEPHDPCRNPYAPIDADELAPLRPGWPDTFPAIDLAATDEPRPGCRSVMRAAPHGETRQIDHILVRNFEPTACRVVVETADASDHWPVLATMTL